MTSNPQRTLRTALHFLDIFREMHETIPSQMVATFIVVAEQGEVTRREMAEALKVDESSAFRNLAHLGGDYTLNGRHKVGLGLVVKETDAREARRNVYRLTTKGERVALRVLNILGKLT